MYNKNPSKYFNGVIVCRLMQIHFVTFTHTLFTLAALSFQKEKKRRQNNIGFHLRKCMVKMVRINNEKKNLISILNVNLCSVLMYVQVFIA